MSSSHKRRYSPTIDDIRQLNIKKFKLLDDLSSLSLSNDQSNAQYTTPDQNRMDVEKPGHVEYISDIEEYLVHNQSDQDIIESTREKLADSEKLEVPENVGLMDTDFLSFVAQRAKELNNGNRLALIGQSIDGIGLTRDGRISFDYKEMLKEYYYKRNRYELVKYVRPCELVRKIWERWYFQEYKLRQFDNDFMIDDEEEESKAALIKDHVDFDGNSIRNSYGGYYQDNHNDDSELMDLD